MPVPDIPDGFFEVQVAIAQEGTPHIASISFGGQFAGLFPVAELTDIRDTYEAALPNLLQDCSSSISAVGLRVIWSPVTGGRVSQDVSFTAGVDGGGADDPFAPQAAYVLRKFTGNFGRHGRGRCFIPGVEEAKTSVSGTLKTTAIGAMQNHAQSFFDALVTPGGALTAYAPYLLANIGGTITPQVLLALQYGPKIGWLRRRYH